MQLRLPAFLTRKIELWPTALPVLRVQRATPPPLPADACNDDDENDLMGPLLRIRAVTPPPLPADACNDDDEELEIVDVAVVAVAVAVAVGSKGKKGKKVVIAAGQRDDVSKARQPASPPATATTPGALALPTPKKSGRSSRAARRLPPRDRSDRPGR